MKIVKNSVFRSPQRIKLAFAAVSLFVECARPLKAVKIGFMMTLIQTSELEWSSALLIAAESFKAGERKPYLHRQKRPRYTVRHVA